MRVPEEHVYRGLDAQTVEMNGRTFDWPIVTRGLFHVRLQKKRKEDRDAAVAIEPQGDWSFITASDMRSKSTLSLIPALVNLPLSEPRKGGPVLAQPVGM